MKRGVTWTQLGVAVGVVAMLGVVSPALGGPSLRELVRQEVAKQLGNGPAATAKKKKKAKPVAGPPGPAGPAGPPGANSANGTNGLNGVNGADGTARAYARVVPHDLVTCGLGGCMFSDSKGVTFVGHDGTGDYCVTVPGIDGTAIAAAVSVDFAATSSIEGNTSAQADTDGCTGGAGPGFRVRTFRWTAAMNAAAADNVGFTIVIP